MKHVYLSMLITLWNITNPWLICANPAHNSFLVGCLTSHASFLVGYLACFLFSFWSVCLPLLVRISSAACIASCFGLDLNLLAWFLSSCIGIHGSSRSLEWGFAAPTQESPWVFFLVSEMTPFCCPSSRDLTSYWSPSLMLLKIVIYEQDN